MKTETKHAMAEAYNKFKDFEGQRYTGMKVGRSHKWYYDRGEWKEKKITPEQWQFTYETPKRRAGKAPEGSGVPVGTAHHWFILAHQTVEKLKANDYSTSMTGMKFKLAHKRVDKDTWSASDRAQRKHLIKILQQMIADLERQAAAEQKTPAARQPTRRRAALPNKATKKKRRQRAA